MSLKPQDTPAARALWGVDYLGRPFVDDSLPWVRYVPERQAIQLLPDLAADTEITEYVSGGILRVRVTEL